MTFLDSDFYEKYVKVYVPDADLADYQWGRDTPDLQVRRVASLAVIRWMLVYMGVCSQCKAFDIAIQRYPSGQPYLVGAPLQLSLSHSQQYLGLCVSENIFPIGIDVESMARKRPISDIAQHTFFEDERHAVEHGAQDIFYKLWGVKESIAKCLGEGLSQALSVNGAKALVDEIVFHKDHAFYIHHQVRGDISLTLAQQDHPLSRIEFI